MICLVSKLIHQGPVKVYYPIGIKHRDKRKDRMVMNVKMSIGHREK
jgi:hypothetical protein